MYKFLNKKRLGWNKWGQARNAIRQRDKGYLSGFWLYEVEVSKMKIKILMVWFN